MITKLKMLKLLPWLIVSALGVSLFLWFFSIPPGYDPAVSFAVADSIRKTYGKFVPNRQANGKDKGATLYASPRRDFGTELTIYKVTEPLEINEVEAAARLALQSVRGAKSVEIHFLRAEVWEQTSGGQNRGNEIEVQSSIIFKNEQGK
jgi:hypothetical protein